MKLYICKHCKNIAYMVQDAMVQDANVNPVCCGEKMHLMVAGETEGAAEKHLPVVARGENGVEVRIGSVEHPMLEEHFIQWVCLETNKGAHFVYLAPGSAPVAHFALPAGEEPLAAYEYCNLHGLWKTAL